MKKHNCQNKPSLKTGRSALGPAGIEWPTRNAWAAVSGLAVLLLSATLGQGGQNYLYRPGPLSAGGDVSVALSEDGQVWQWGNLFHGGGRPQTPGRVGGLDNVSFLAAGEGHFVVALKSGGTVWTWGQNGSGQLGDGTMTARDTPAVVPNLAEVVRIAVGGSAGAGHVVAMKADGTVWAWGDNADGQLGDGTRDKHLTPTQVMVNGQPLTEVCAIAAGKGSDYTLAATWNGPVWAWGENPKGQLGDGTKTGQLSPVQVSGGVSAIRRLFAGPDSAWAQTSDGKIWTWGGLYQDGTPYLPSEGSQPADPLRIVAGSSHYLTLKSDGHVWAWGLNTYGQLGDGTTTDGGPLQVPGLSEVTAIAADNWYSMALKADGTVWAWGANTYGQLGDNTVTERHAPVQVIGLQSLGARGLGGMTAGTIIPHRGAAWGTGYNGNGQMGNGMIIDQPTPVQASGLLDIITVGAGYNHVAAMLAGGTAWAWGANESGQLGDGTTAERHMPAQTGLSLFAALAGGSRHTVALKPDGTVQAWGNNFYGQLGDGTISNRYQPVAVMGVSNIVDIAAASHSMALRGDGRVFTWGYNEFGQLGDGVTALRRSTPLLVDGLSNVTAIAASERHTVALKADGTVQAWGDNSYGQLGDGIFDNHYTPAPVPGLSNVTAITAGGLHTVALKADGSVWAWGGNLYGELGDGTTTERDTPIRIGGLANVIDIAAGYFHTVALKSDGTIWACGQNDHGQLGDGTMTNRHTPVRINFTADSVGDGIPDFWRQQYFGGTGQTTNSQSCATCDASGTGRNNRYNYIAGLNPVNPADAFLLQITKLAGQSNRMNLTYQPVVSGREYAIQFKTNVMQAAYLTLTGFSGPQANGNQASVTDLNPALRSKFYRVCISLPGSCTPAPSGLISWWAGEANASDSIGTNNGVLLNGATFAAGKVGQAFSFDGIDDVLRLGGAPLPAPWTAEFWVNRQDSLNDSATLLGDAATALKLEQWPNTRRVGFTKFGVADYSFNYTAPTGTWVHLVFVGSASDTRLYVNGVSQDTQPASIALPLGQIGGDIPNRYSNRLKGLVDEASIYNRALAASEIQAIYSAGSAGKCP